MYALTDYYGAISSLPLSGDMLPSALMSNTLSLLPSGHEACFFLCGVQTPPCRVQMFALPWCTTEPPTLYLWPSKLMRFIRAELHLSPPQMSVQFLLSMPLLPSVPVTSALQPPSPGHGSPSTPSSASHRSDSLSLSWYHRNHADQAQKFRAPYSWSGN